MRKLLTILILLGLIGSTAALSRPDQTLRAQSAATPAATAAATAAATEQAQPVAAIFTQISKVGTLSLTVYENRTAYLEMQSLEPDQNGSKTVWQQAGLVEQAALDQLKALNKNADFAGLAASYAPDPKPTDCSILTLTLKSDQGDHSVAVSCWTIPQPPVVPPVLKDTLDLMLGIRLPLETLVVFEWGGGIAARITELSVRHDGTLTLQDLNRKKTQMWTVSQDDLKPLRTLLQSEEYLTMQPTPGTPGMCADCFLYAISVMTPKGIMKIDADEETIRRTYPPIVTKAIGLLQKLQATAPKAS